MASLVLSAYELTGKKEYLDAVRESLIPAKDCANQEVCREIRAAPDAFLKWRTITGSGEFDAAFGYTPDPEDAAILKQMAADADAASEKMAYNWDILTSEVLYTDRVYYALPAAYSWRLFGGEAPRGDRYPFFAVTWPAGTAEFARALLESGAGRLRISLYGFDAAGAEIEARLWRLKPGAYRWRLGAETGRFTVTTLPHGLRLRLPARQELILTVENAP
jgi:hypothetical protein